MQMKKKIICFAVIGTMILSLAGCSSDGKKANNVSSDTSKTQQKDVSNEEVSETEEEETREEESKEKEKEGEKLSSNPKNDTDVGLKNTKIDNADESLTDEQRELISVFDSDYLYFNTELFSRYPQYLKGCQIQDTAIVKKIISSDDDEFVFVTAESDQHNAGADTETYNMYVKCKQMDTRFLEGDYIFLYGRYTGTEVVEIDGQSYSLPVIEGYSKSYLEYENHSYMGVAVYPYSDVKRFAETLFGKNIILDTVEELYTPDLAEIYQITFENQSNANFSKCMVYAYRYGFGISGSDSNDNEYSLIVASDFEHFYYIGTYQSTNTTKVAYYDKDFQKIWEREFEDTENVAYDYTKNNIYMTLNNNLYIIDAKTGEDTYDPIYVGKQGFVRKTEDGIYLIKTAETGEYIRADVVMKYDLKGNLLWTTSLESDFNRCEGIQFVNDNLLFEYYDQDYTDTVAVIDTKTGKLLNTCKSVTVYG